MYWSWVVTGADTSKDDGVLLPAMNPTLATVSCLLVLEPNASDCPSFKTALSKPLTRPNALAYLVVLVQVSKWAAFPLVAFLLPVQVRKGSNFDNCIIIVLNAPLPIYRGGEIEREPIEASQSGTERSL